MVASVLVDAGFLVALLSRRDAHHAWAAAMAEQHPPPWKTCEAALSETVHLLGPVHGHAVHGLLERKAVTAPFDLDEHLTPVLKLLHKYADVPMSLADAALVRMTETLADPILLTTDTDFRVYRCHGRQIVPCILPS